MTVYSNKVCGGLSVSGWNDKFVQWYSTSVDKLKKKINEEMEELPGSLADALKDILAGERPDIDMEEVSEDLQEVAEDVVQAANKDNLPVNKPLESDSNFAGGGYSEGTALENLAIGLASDFVLDRGTELIAKALNKGLGATDGPVRVYLDADLTAKADLVIEGGLMTKLTLCSERGKHTFKTSIGWQIWTDLHGDDLNRAVADFNYEWFRGDNNDWNLRTNVSLGSGPDGTEAALWIGGQFGF